MKKIFLFISLNLLLTSIIFCQEFSYQLLGPFGTYGQEKFSEYYWKGDLSGFKKFCLETAQNSLKSIYNKNAKDILLVSGDIKDDEALKNIIYIRANISRMQLSYELLGKENFQYALRTTGGIEFFNVRTGEVYFSKIYTIIQPKQIIKGLKDPLMDANKDDFYNLFKNNIKELFDYLFKKAKEEYKPGIITANIVKTVSSFAAGKTGVLESRVIVNKGRLQGIAERQQFRFSISQNKPIGIKLKIVEIQDNYSVASIISPKSFDINPGEEISRSGGVEISSKYPLRMMVQGTEFLDNTQIDSRYNVDPGFITQIVHDNLSDNSSFAILPYGSIAELQLEATKGGEKEEEVIGNRMRPDLYIKCSISKAFVYSTDYEGGQYLKLVVSPVLIFYDANLGNILYTVTYDEENLQVIKENERMANISEQFEILTKNAIYEVTKKAKQDFSLIYTKGSITNSIQNEFKIETGQLSLGTIFRVFKSSEELIDPISSKSLGKLLTFIGNLKTREASGSKGKGDMLFSTSSISNGDVLLANSDKNLTKGTIIIQPGDFKVTTNSGGIFSEISKGAVELATLQSLVQSKRFNVLLPKKDIDKIKIDQQTLEPAGHFKIEAESEEKNILKPQAILSSEFLIFPPEIKSEEEKKLIIGQYFIVNSTQDNKQLIRKGKKQELPLEGEKSKDKVQVGLSEKDFPKHYIDMCKSLSLLLSDVIADELQNILK
jgi:hypothetical protein